VRAPALAERLKRDGVEPMGGTPQAFGALIGKEIKEWQALAQAARISLE
jgi:tripartite-type tricarboxylate transporter receptor subunit TctC